MTKQLLIPNLKEKFEALKIRATRNYEFIKEIIKDSPLFENIDMVIIYIIGSFYTQQSYYGFQNSNIEPAHPSDMEKVKTTIRQFVRYLFHF